LCEGCADNERDTYALTEMYFVAVIQTFNEFEGYG